MRDLTRRNLIYYLDIEDNESGNSIGKLADISLNGLLVVSEEPVDKKFSGVLRIVMPFENFIEKPVAPIKVETRWHRVEKKTGYNYYGMEIINNSIELEKTISLLIARIGFSDGEKKARQGLFSQDFY